jgi:hypothetical protein
VSGTSWIKPGSALKKSLRASEQDRADVARRQWQERQGKVCATRLIFIDETPGSSPIGAKITWSSVDIVAFFAAAHANVV